MGKPDLFPALVAVPNRSAGGFDIFSTGGMRDPQRWMHGRLDFQRYHASKADLEAAAAVEGRRLVRVADFYALPMREA